MLATCAAVGLLGVALGGVPATAAQPEDRSVAALKERSVVRDGGTVRPELDPEERAELVRRVAAAAADEVPAARSLAATVQGADPLAAADGYAFDESLMFGGTDRYQTAMIASWYSGLGDSDLDGEIGEGEVATPVVYVVNGQSFPDALSAAAPAAHEGGVLLMTEADALHPSTRFELERLLPERIILVGGDAAISPDVADEIGAIGDAVVERRAGATRYETARAVIEAAYPDGPLNPFVYLTSGAGYADALAAGSPAALFGVPVVPVDGSADEIDAETLALLESLDVSGVEIAGGEAAVSAGIEAQLEGIYGAGGQVVRSSGATRYETAAALIEGAHGVVYDETRTDSDPSNDFTAPEAFFGSGRDFPDALVGGAIAGFFHEPFYPLDERCGIAPAVEASLNHLGPDLAVFTSPRLEEQHLAVGADGVLPTC